MVYFKLFHLKAPPVLLILSMELMVLGRLYPISIIYLFNLSIQVFALVHLNYMRQYRWMGCCLVSDLHFEWQNWILNLLISLKLHSFCVNFSKMFSMDFLDLWRYLHLMQISYLSLICKSYSNYDWMKT